MGLFTQRPSRPPPSTSPLVTYHITQSLSSTLTATPTTTTTTPLPSDTDKYPPLTIALTRPKTRRDSIEIAVQRAADGATVGHCVVQVSTGKFLACKLSHADGHRDVTLSHSGHGEGATYALGIDGEAGAGAGAGTGSLRWVHDVGGLHGGTVNAERRFRLEGGGGDGQVLARFAGASGGVSEFGMLEVYEGGGGKGESGGGGGGDEGEGGEGEGEWCGLLVLTAVCVYAREERHREKQDKVKSKFEVVSGLGDLIGLVAGI